MAIPALAGGAVVSFVFDQLFNGAHQLINHATHSGILLERMASQEVMRCIENARVAYVDSMTQTMSQIDATTSASINSLHHLVNDALTTLSANAQTISRRAQQLTNTLPMSNHTPQLTTASPNVIYRAPTDTTSVFFNFSGNFWDASDPTYTPTISFAANTYQPARTSTQDLTFDVPIRSIFSQHELQTANTRIFKRGTLSIPWPSGLLGARKTATFQVLIGALPPSPGTLTLNYSVPQRNERVSKGGYMIHSRSGPYVCGPNDCGGEDCRGNDTDKHHDFVRRATPGWSVVPGSAYANVSRDVGNCQRWGAPLPIERNDHVVCTAHSWRNWGSSAGFMEFELGFKETQTVMIPKSDPLNIIWGQTLSITPPNGWQLNYTPFDNPTATSTFVAAFTTKYLRVDNVSAGKFHVVALVEEEY